LAGEDLTVGGDHVDRGLLLEEQVGGGLLEPALFRAEDALALVEVVEQRLGVVAERAQEHGGRQLAAPVDADVEDVLAVELEVDPRAAVRDDARREDLLLPAGLAAAGVEEDARAAVE